MIVDLFRVVMHLVYYSNIYISTTIYKGFKNILYTEPNFDNIVKK